MPEGSDIAGTERLIERADIHLGAGQIEGEGAGGGGAEALRLGAQCSAQVLEDAAEVGAGGGFGAVRPEGAGKPVAADFRTGAQCEEGEEPLRLAGAQ